MAKEATRVVPGDVEANSGHLRDSNGNVVLSGTGQCVYNGSWSEADAINVCEGIDETIAEATPPAPVVAPIVNKLPETTAAEVEPAPVIETVVLKSRALFSTDADSLSVKGDKAMQRLIAKLGDFSKIEKVEIVGYTDAKGSETYNLGLSKRRADAIKSYLVGSYNDAEITTMGMGEADPSASNDTAEGCK
ncbi:MAG TPA: hypothetical protein DD979_11865, partial [Gammaproteobacteria bacterium]|nr:hypothetical protein [Gammaproteobacteria bacterium]